jgi:hypothetical protein
LLLDETTRADTIDELKGDLENTRWVDNLGAEWSERISRRSVFKKLTNLQICLALENDHFEWSDMFLFV